MFWRKKEEEQKAAEQQPAAEKPCCSEKKKEDAQSEQTAAPVPPQQQQQAPAGLSTFEFGGSISSNIKLVGNCQGTDPNSIQACQWRPSSDPKHTILF